MRKPRSIARLSDLFALATVTGLFLLSPASPYQPKPFTITDKVEIYHRRVLPADSLRQALRYVEEEKRAMEYYLRTHSIDDNGFPLVAQYNNRLQAEYRQLCRDTTPGIRYKTTTVRIPARERPFVAYCTEGGYWRGGRFYLGKPFSGKAIMRDWRGRIVSALIQADTIATATRIDAQGVYQGQMDSQLMACGQGVMDEWDGCHKEGFWREDVQHGFGFDSSPQHQLRVGEWKNGKFLGERLRYTAERIYGIDISRHQHEKGRKLYGINWQQLRITSLGERHQTEGRTFPISFIYIKATEGVTIKNRYFSCDYHQARRHNLRVGAYHFFSMSTPALQQVRHFLRYSIIKPDDLPPVLDVEPSESQIKKMGEEELMHRIRQFMQIVEIHTGKRPILYVSQGFVNNHMKNAADIKQKYNVWIARYSQYKPDLKLLFWQLCPDGKVEGITGPVDINVFNGYQGQYEEFLRTGFHQ